VVPGHSGQFTPGGYLSTVKHTVLAAIEPRTFQLLVRRATSCATKTNICETTKWLFKFSMVTVRITSEGIIRTNGALTLETSEYEVNIGTARLTASKM